jgi:hypothetical protein
MLPGHREASSRGVPKAMLWAPPPNSLGIASRAAYKLSCLLSVGRASHGILRVVVGRRMAMVRAVFKAWRDVRGVGPHNPTRRECCEE